MPVGCFAVLKPLAGACGGFLLAVLWMDLIFDVQVLAHRKAGNELPEAVLASIANYYHRATTTSRPMSWLIAGVMVILLSTLALHGVRGTGPSWVDITTAALAAGPILLALAHTVPRAVRLGNRAGDVAEQTRLARVICREHLVCTALMLAFLLLWVGAAG
ncbi:MAG: hypothetical protein JO152_08880 [Mycobacteriaceae bacterium]|nr:hypothetical protein [Mycobacteriaceae bacterium]